MDKISYEFKGIKVSIEANEKSDRSDVEIAINNANNIF